MLTHAGHRVQADQERYLGFVNTVSGVAGGMCSKSGQLPGVLQHMLKHLNIARCRNATSMLPLQLADDQSKLGSRYSIQQRDLFRSAVSAEGCAYTIHSHEWC